jgi:hypothetical protein
MTSSPMHEDLGRGRWRTLSLLEQLANIGSEVERALTAVERGKVERRDAAVDRALELFDFTAADERWHGVRRREVLRAREAFCTEIFGDGGGREGRDSLRRYFLHFAVAARRGT